MMRTSHDADETRRIAEGFGSLLHAGDLVLLVGDLGAGKTTFVQGIARALGVEGPVTSPTFTIVQQYDGRVPVAHVDVYRLQRMQEVHDLALDELLDRHVVLVEWGDVVEPALRGDRAEVRLSHGDDINIRTIEIVGDGPSWPARMAQLEGAIASRNN
ncbi:MAG TPA: tRNA (adenosine(37)-N6)-threonylcarbamoyltransferase complex ATPase subunit type 1 TsaE [Acidimicrobiia bacterium]|jgi:tRNA threonylcarbamoyladenosine biosynthesis protein TsaE|nr:tRNA (adenosine(37)-N6)-threonylcarbamoyltransferase complex ATPase subunit type 1 TsaE [Acidimicrobiia bacterium]